MNLFEVNSILGSTVENPWTSLQQLWTGVFAKK